MPREGIDAVTVGDLKRKIADLPDDMPIVASSVDFDGELIKVCVENGKLQLWMEEED